jgi:hypothetical protein
VTLISALPNPSFQQTPPPAAGPLQAALLISDSSTGFNVCGIDLAEAWYTFNIQVTASDNTLGLTNTTFQLQVITSADCTQVSGLELPVDFPSVLNYQVGTGLSQTTLFPAVFSQTSRINDVCGPIGYQVRLTDSTGLFTDVIPAFVSFDSTLLELEIDTTDATQAGTHYLSFDVYLSNFAG